MTNYACDFSQSDAENYFGQMNNLKCYLVPSSVARDKINLRINMSWDPFLESPDNQLARKAVVASSKIKVSIVWHLTR